MQQEKGFTLIEMILATALLGLLAAAIFSFYHLGVRSWQKGIARIDHQQNARAAMELIDRELRFAAQVEIVQSGELRYKLLGDKGFERPSNYRRFRLSNEQLLMEEIRGGKTHSCNVVALGVSEVNFTDNAFGNITIIITAGEGGSGVILRSSVVPRNLSKPEAPRGGGEDK